MLGVIRVGSVIDRSRLRWFGHVVRRSGEMVQEAMEEGRRTRSRGRPRMTWEEGVLRLMKGCGLRREDAFDRGRWRTAIHGTRPTPAGGETGR